MSLSPRLSRLGLIGFTTLMLLLAGKASIAQPFGIAEGTPTANLNVVRERAPYRFEITPALTHPSFERYFALSTPQAGVCRVVGVGVTLRNDAYGDQVRELFKLLTEQLSAKYGNSKLFDILNVGSIWREPNDWSMGLLKQDRNYVRFWDKEEHSTLQNGVRAVTLQAKSVSSDQTYIELIFEFNNINRCLDKVRSIGAGAL